MKGGGKEEAPGKGKQKGKDLGYCTAREWRADPNNRHLDDLSQQAVPDQCRGKKQPRHSFQYGQLILTTDPTPYPQLPQLFREPNGLEEIVYPRYLDEPRVQCASGTPFILSRLPFQNKCLCQGCKARGTLGWPQWIIREYYRRILSLAPLPWAHIVKADFQSAQWRASQLWTIRDKQKVTTPPPGLAPPAQVPAKDQREGYQVKLLQSSDPEKKHQLFARNCQCPRNDGLQDAGVSPRLAQATDAKSVLTDTQGKLKKTIRRISDDISVLKQERDTVSELLNGLQQHLKQLNEREAKIQANESMQSQVEQLLAQMTREETQEFIRSFKEKKQGDEQIARPKQWQRHQRKGEEPEPGNLSASEILSGLD